MDITISTETELIEKARANAAARGQTLDEAIREFVTRLAADLDADQAASEFATLALKHGGRSDDGFVFDREATHARGKQA